MTQLTQGSDMELQDAIATAINVGSRNANTRRFYVKKTMQLIQADKQRSIDRAVAEALIDEQLVWRDWPGTLSDAGIRTTAATRIKKLEAELEQQLSPTTEKEAET